MDITLLSGAITESEVTSTLLNEGIVVLNADTRPRADEIANQLDRDIDFLPLDVEVAGSYYRLLFCIDRYDLPIEHLKELAIKTVLDWEKAGEPEHHVFSINAQ